MLFIRGVTAVLSIIKDPIFSIGETANYEIKRMTTILAYHLSPTKVIHNTKEHEERLEEYR